MDRYFDLIYAHVLNSTAGSYVTYPKDDVRWLPTNLCIMLYLNLNFPNTKVWPLANFLIKEYRNGFYFLFAVLTDSFDHIYNFTTGAQ